MAPSRSSRTRDLQARAADAAGCTRCDLHRRATQTVFGEGQVDCTDSRQGSAGRDRAPLLAALSALTALAAARTPRR